MDCESLAYAVILCVEALVTSAVLRDTVGYKWTLFTIRFFNGMKTLSKLPVVRGVKVNYTILR